jgi:hypothetical protein
MLNVLAFPMANSDDKEVTFKVESNNNQVWQIEMTEK